MRKRRHWVVAAAVVALLAAAAAGALLAFGSGSSRSTATTPTQPSPPVGPPSLGREIDDALGGLRFGNLAFNAPTALRPHQAAEIHLVVSRGQSIAELKQRVAEVGVKRGARVALSNDMVAHLSGLGFAIDRITPEQQLVTAVGPTNWLWQIQPTETGTLHLHLTLSAVVLVRGSSQLHSIRTFDQTLTIHVGWGERLTTFLGDNWQWLWTAVLVPIAAFLVRRRRREQPSGPAG
jgi:hypothetical protein